MRYRFSIAAMIVATMLALFAVVQTPGISQFFGCTPLDPISWLVVLGWAAAGTAGAELLPGLVARWRGEPVLSRG